MTIVTFVLQKTIKIFVQNCNELPFYCMAFPTILKIRMFKNFLTYVTFTSIFALKQPRIASKQKAAIVIKVHGIR